MTTNAPFTHWCGRARRRRLKARFFSKRAGQGSRALLAPRAPRSTSARPRSYVDTGREDRYRSILTTFTGLLIASNSQHVTNPPAAGPEIRTPLAITGAASTKSIIWNVRAGSSGCDGVVFTAVHAPPILTSIPADVNHPPPPPPLGSGTCSPSINRTPHTSTG